MEWTPIVGCAYDCTITPGDASLTCDIAIQLLDFAGNNLTEASSVMVYFSAGDNDKVIDNVGGNISETGDGDLVELLDNYVALVISSTSGDMTVNLNGSASENYYCNVILPSGKIVTSEAIAITG